MEMYEIVDDGRYCGLLVPAWMKRSWKVLERWLDGNAGTRWRRVDE